MKPVKKPEYVVCSGYSEKEIEEHVNKQMAEGYEPYGFLTVTRHVWFSLGEPRNGLVFVQAMKLVSP